MASSDVFRPSNGPLLIRDNIGNTFGSPMGFKHPVQECKKPETPRPSTQGGYRFGQLSHNSFFARHNPHPGRVRHIKGLLDMPICAVNDEGYFANPRYSMNFPPNAFNVNKVNRYSKYYNMPANSINVNTQRYPINTITGLQYFMGKPLNFRIFREQAQMRKGIVPVHEAWRDELQALAHSAGLGNKPKSPCLDDPMKPRAAQYSADTGRLIPPPSRAMSRGASRQSRKEQFYNRWQQYVGEQEPDMEGMILQMLCQILQTDDISAVQQWLVSSGDREKALVLDMIRSAISTQDEYYSQHPPEYIEPDPVRPSASRGLNQHGGDNAGAMDANVYDRLEKFNIDNGSGRPATSNSQDGRWTRFSWNKNQENTSQREVIHEDEEYRPPTTDVFKPRQQTAQSDRPKSKASCPKTPSKPGTPLRPLTSEPKLRYTNTPLHQVPEAKQESEQEKS